MEELLMPAPIKDIPGLEHLIQVGLGNHYFKVKSITAVNHKPHRYVIGAPLVAFAADHYGGMLSEHAIAGYERQGGRCGHPGCNLIFAEHTYEYALFLQPLRDIPNKLAAQQLMGIKPLMEKNGIAGVALVESPKGFKVALPIKKDESTSDKNKAGS
jgi:hypothetical protein